MANWLVTVNYKDFNLEDAFEELTQIYWKNDHKNSEKGLQVGDHVFVFVTKPISQVLYTFIVKEYASSSEVPENQKEYWKDLDKFINIKKFAVLNKVKKLDKPTLTFEYFVENKLIKKAPIQGRRTDRNKIPEDPISIFLNHLYKEFYEKNLSIDYPDEVSSATFPEGGKKVVSVNRYERNPKARLKCIEYHGLSCKICEMRFEKTYGYFAKDFIHVHHIKPLYEMSDTYKIDPIKDLIPVCPNCHAMLHQVVDGVPMSIEKLKMLYESSNSKYDS